MLAGTQQAFIQTVHHQTHSSVIYVYPLFDNPIIQKQGNSVTIAAKVRPITNRFPVKRDVDTITDSCIGCSDTPSLMPATSLISAPPEQTEKHWNVFYDTAAGQIDFSQITQGSSAEYGK